MRVAFIHQMENKYPPNLTLYLIQICHEGIIFTKTQCCRSTRQTRRWLIDAVRRKSPDVVIIIAFLFDDGRGDDAWLFSTWRWLQLSATDPLLFFWMAMTNWWWAMLVNIDSIGAISFSFRLVNRRERFNFETNKQSLVFHFRHLLPPVRSSPSSATSSSLRCLSLRLSWVCVPPESANCVPHSLCRRPTTDKDPLLVRDPGDFRVLRIYPSIAIPKTGARSELISLRSWAVGCLLVQSLVVQETVRVRWGSESGSAEGIDEEGFSYIKINQETILECRWRKERTGEQIPGTWW